MARSRRRTTQRPLPKRIPGLVTWLRSTDVAGAAGGAVSLWPDRSGQGNPFQQASAAKKPTLQTGVVNGLPVVRFDGVDDILVSDLSLFTAVPSTPATMFVVARCVSTPADGPAAYNLLGKNALADNYGLGFARGDGNHGKARHPQAYVDKTLTASQIAISSLEYRTGGFAVLSGAWDGTGVSLYRNGLLEQTVASNATTLGATANSQPWALGALTYGGVDQFFGNVDIAEVLIYNRLLAAGERQLIENFLRARYGLLSLGAPDTITGLSTWYRADDISGLVLGNPVASWADAILSGNVLEQGGAGLKPLFRPGQVNGHAAVRFDGTDDLLVSAGSHDWRTVFLVVDVLSWTFVGMAFSFPNNTDLSIRLNSVDDGNWRGVADVNAGDWTNGNPTKLFVDGVNTEVYPAGFHSLSGERTVLESGAFALGGHTDATRYANLDVAELIAFNKTLTTAERQAVEAYLRSRYGLA